MVAVLRADARHLPLDDESVHCVVTSPPYWGLRNYGVDAQLGLETTPEEYVENMVGVFREARRVLRRDGTLWLNLGDSYAGSRMGKQGQSGFMADRSVASHRMQVGRVVPADLKPKDLVGIPWRVAFALQADGWWLRSDIVWAKPNPMPESVTDRPTRSHEYLFLLAKSARYYYDADAIREPHEMKPQRRPGGRPLDQVPRGTSQPRQRWSTARRDEVGPDGHPLGRNRRSVWTIATQPFVGEHFATFPPKLVEPCILAGCPEGGVVLDPFCGTGTVGEVALANRRRAVLSDINGEYLTKLVPRRLANVQVNLL